MSDEMELQKLSRSDVLKATEIVEKKLKQFFWAIYPADAVVMTKSEYLEEVRKKLWIVDTRDDFDRACVGIITLFELNFFEKDKYLRDVSKDIDRDIIVRRLEDTINLAKKDFDEYMKTKVPKEGEIISHVEYRNTRSMNNNTLDLNDISRQRIKKLLEVCINTAQLPGGMNTNDMYFIMDEIPEMLTSHMTEMKTLDPSQMGDMLLQITREIEVRISTDREIPQEAKNKMKEFASNIMSLFQQEIHKTFFDKKKEGKERGKHTRIDNVTYLKFPPEHPKNNV